MKSHKKLFCALAALSGAVAAQAAAGLTVKAALPFSTFVIGEDVVVSANVENISGMTYIVDDYAPYDQNEVAVVVRNPRGNLLLKKNGGAAVPELSLAPGQGAALELRVSDLFDLSEEGRYMLSIEAFRGEEGVASRSIPFTIVPGINIRTVSRATPGSADMREYQLLYWPRNEREYLFLRVRDSKGGPVRGFAPLGTVVRVEEPKIDFDAGGGIVVTHQSDRDKFVRTTLAPTGGGAFEVRNAQSLTSTLAIQEAEATAEALKIIAEKESDKSSKKLKPMPKVEKPPLYAPPAQPKKK